MDLLKPVIIFYRNNLFTFIAKKKKHKFYTKGGYSSKVEQLYVA